MSFTCLRFLALITFEGMKAYKQHLHVVQCIHIDVGYLTNHIIKVVHSQSPRIKRKPGRPGWKLELREI